MRSTFVKLAALLCSAWVVASADPAAAESRTVMHVTVIDTHGKTAEYLSMVKKTIERQHQVAPGIRTRIFQATFAGAQTGLLYIVLEYPSAAFMVDAHDMLAGDPEWNALRKQSGIATGRTLVSDSLFVEVTP